MKTTFKSSKAHFSKEFNQEDTLERYKYLSRRIDKISDAYKKNIVGALTDEELEKILNF